MARWPHCRGNSGPSAGAHRLGPWVRILPGRLCMRARADIGRGGRPSGRHGQMWIARPSTARAASLTASASVGWAWQVRAMSSLLAPNSMATAASAIRSPARGPRMCTPSTRSVFASARILTRPSVWPRARGAAVGDEREDALPVGDRRRRLSSSSVLPTDGDLGRGVDDAGDRVVVDVAVAAGERLDAGDALLLGLVREHRAPDHVADGVDARRGRGEVLVDRDAALRRRA